MLSKWIILILLGSLPFGQDFIGDGLYEEGLIDFLRENYKTSSTLSYGSARDVMYGNIDNYDGTVYGIYTNFSVSNVPVDEPRPTVHAGGLNCEHVWPQSMYEDGGDNSLMRCDLHQLRPCKSNVNQSRGNNPFNENPNSQTDNWFWLDQNLSSIPTSNIDEYSESEISTDLDFFEPREDRKGDIARTMFYFYTMYSEVADDDFFEGQKEVLKTWHELDSADEEEIIRTWQIADYQENKPNPFIVDATLVERAYL